jgi:tetratricopeptide (TPR) repeat protein
MPCRILALLGLGVLAVFAGASCPGSRLDAQSPSSAPTIPDAYAAWLAGDHQVIARTFPDAQALRAMRGDLQRTLRLWQRSWKPSQAGFLLELSLIGFDRQWNEASDLLAGTRDFVVNRPAAPGANPAEDAFELDFHRAAVTFFLGRQLLRPASEYLNALAGRVDLVPATTGKPRLVDPWTAFARGLAAEIATAPGLRPLSRAPDAAATLIIGADDDTTRRQAEAALNEFSRVRDVTSLAAEGAVRRGLLLFRLDRPDDALAALDEAEAAAGDVTVRYWTWLFRGRVLERFDRHVEAAAAYERAAATIPGAQTPAVALASLWQRHDRPADALTWARRAMATPPGVADPWWFYWHGDLRFASDRLAAVRRGRP